MKNISQKEVLIVDQDDVICTNGFLYLINRFLGTNYTYDDFLDFYMQDIIPNKDDFFKWFVTKNMYDHCELIPGCYDALNELNKQYELYIATSYIYPEIVSKCGFILGQKFDYFKKNLPFISPYQYIFISNKKLLNGDIKIDDRLDNLDGANTKLLFDAFHNRKYSDEFLSGIGVERMNDWFDIKRRLLKK